MSDDDTTTADTMTAAPVPVPGPAPELEPFEPGPKRLERAYTQGEDMLRHGDRGIVMVILDGAGGMHVASVANDSDAEARDWATKVFRLIQRGILAAGPTDEPPFHQIGRRPRGKLS